MEICGFVDENRRTSSWLGTKVIGDFQSLKKHLLANKDTAFHYITATGDNATRQQMVEKIKSLRLGNLSAFTLKYPDVFVGDYVEVDEGTCLAPGSIITTRVTIGSHCIVNVNASVSHDCRVSDFVNINPQAVICGNVTLGRASYIGAGAIVIDKVKIGTGTIIGAGSLVIKDIPAHVVAVGSPAKIIKRIKN